MVQIEEFDAGIRALEEEKSQAMRDEDFERCAQIRDEINQVITIANPVALGRG
jgi:protein-arginine kinase activator protein McsA